MNIISNCCLGGNIYTDILQSEFKNPFIWSRINTNDFYTLLKNFENINFNSFFLDKTTCSINDPFKIVIDNKINVIYTHYFFDKNCNSIKIDGRNIYYNKIWEYIVNKYKSRLIRMNKSPIIAFQQVPHYDEMTEENIEKIISICHAKNFPSIFIIDNIKKKYGYNDIFSKRKYTLSA